MQVNLSLLGLNAQVLPTLHLSVIILWLNGRRRKLWSLDICWTRKPDLHVANVVDIGQILIETI